MCRGCKARCEDLEIRCQRDSLSQEGKGILFTSIAGPGIKEDCRAGFYGLAVIDKILSGGAWEREWCYGKEPVVLMSGRTFSATLVSEIIVNILTARILLRGQQYKRRSDRHMPSPSEPRPHPVCNGLEGH
jgi:hypothetical protein